MTLKQRRVKGIIPQPNIGDPGTGDFTLTFLGEAGVAGRADIVGDCAFTTKPVLASN